MRRRFFSSLLLLFMATLTLRAQVDSRLQKCQTDVLDVYGGASAKPEIITLIDSSYSMRALAWDSRYYANVACDWHMGALKWGNPTGDGKKLFMQVMSSSAYTNIKYTVQLVDITGCGGGGGGGGGAGGKVVVLDDPSYGSGTTTTTGVKVKLTEGLLIQPNGNPVKVGDPSVITNSSSAQEWVMVASHVRFAVTSNASGSYTYGGTTYAIPTTNCSIHPNPYSGGAYSTTANNSAAILGRSDNTRVVDIPIPWAVFDRVTNYETGLNHTKIGETTASTMSTTPQYWSTANSMMHPQHMYLYDPVLSKPSVAQWYEVETNWWANKSGNNWDVLADITVAQCQGTTQTGTTTATNVLRRVEFHPDYLAWIFFGQDTYSSSTGTVSAYSGTHSGGYTVIDSRDGGAGFVTNTTDSTTGNGLPAMTRIQAIKYAIIKTYITQQDNVWWAVRFLNDCNGSGSGGSFTESGHSGPGQWYSSSNTQGNPGDRMLLFLDKPSTAQSPNGSLSYIQSKVLLDTANTPLTAALLNTYAQMAGSDNGDAGSLFNANNTESPVPTCRKSYVIVLSDGAPNDNNTTCSGFANYYNTDGVTVNSACAMGTGDPFATGISGVSVDASTIAPRMSSTALANSNYNMWTLSGIAAHSTDSSDSTKVVTVTNPSSGPTDNYTSAGVLPPFTITTRPSGTNRYIETMTIGISMAGALTDSTGAKAAMYKTALYGLHARTSGWTTSSYPLPYDPANSSANSTTTNPFFFDAQSPDGIADALDSAFTAALVVSTSLSAPVAPVSGLGLGNEMYFATFTSGTTGQAVWKGDLMATGLKISGSTYTLVAKDGTTAITVVGPDNALWSASTMLQAKGWKNRNLYTLKPDTTDSTKTTFTTTMLAWNESTSTTDLPNTWLSDSTTTISSTTARQSLLRFMMGASTAAQAETTTTASLTTNRDDMMGDIINSAPLILTFPLSAVPSGTLGTFLGSIPSSIASSSKFFRLIIVGDNQGILHGFGEVSYIDSSGAVQAAVDELWGFIPPDCLSGLATWRSGLTHRYLMDGSPSLYWSDIGSATSPSSGIANGLIDGNDVVRVAFGLRKGGRSYYCLKFTSNDPTKIELAWMLRPDQSTNSVVQKMGFSTSTPAVARVLYDSTIKDVFFIGGGLSTREVDIAFSTTTTTLLGRSILAVRALDGSLVKSWDFSGYSTDMGCIPAPVVPAEVFVNSGMAQRVYFATAPTNSPTPNISSSTGTATYAGVYALGVTASSGSRLDSSNINSWATTPRAIYKSKYTGTAIGSPPTVYTLPYGYPVTRNTTPTAMVAAMGVSFGLGDRNDPMDKDTLNPGGDGTTYANRFITILDRQDSASITNAAGSKVDTYGFSEDDLMNLTSVSSTSDPRITLSASTTDPATTYYLKNYAGYRLEFATRTVKTGSTTSWFYPKSVVTPLVLNSVLFFSKFAPKVQASQCSGAGGSSYLYRLCDVINPVYSGTVDTSSSSCTSGSYTTFGDLHSEIGAVGGLGAIVTGEYVVSGSATSDGKIGTSEPSTGLATTLPRPRAWRVVR